jgi:DNA repair exonuclease SbcCD ATPase subunit
MTLENEGVTADEGVKAEPVEETTQETTTEDQVEETEKEATAEDSPETEVEEVETAEEKNEKLALEVEAKQKKIERQSAANRSLNERYEAQRQEHEKLLQTIEQQKPNVEPKIDDYETHEEYSNARDDFIRKDAIAVAQSELMAQQQQIQRQQLEAQRTTLRQTQEAEYLDVNPMYKAASAEVNTYINGLVDIPLETVDAFAEQLYQGNVPEVIDYFGANNGENLDELGKIARMSPSMAAVEVYKIQQKLVAPVKKESKPLPKPLKTIKGTSKSGKNPLDMSLEELKKAIYK